VEFLRGLFLNLFYSLIIYINDLVELCGQDVNIFLFGDDAKVFNHIRVQDDEVMLHKCTDEFVEWAEKWLIKIHLKI